MWSVLDGKVVMRLISVYIFPNSRQYWSHWLVELRQMKKTLDKTVRFPSRYSNRTLSDCTSEMVAFEPIWALSVHFPYVRILSTIMWQSDGRPHFYIDDDCQYFPGVWLEHYFTYIDYLSPSRNLNRTYTGCIKMIRAVLKLIISTSIVNRIINTSRNERVTQQVYDTYLQIFDVTWHTSRR